MNLFSGYVVLSSRGGVAQLCLRSRRRSRPRRQQFCLDFCTGIRPVLAYMLVCCGYAAAQQLPYMIQQQPVEVQNLYQEATVLVEENGRLENPRPEPYIALADIWASVGAHDDALKNYLNAASVLTTGTSTLEDRARMLARLQIAMADLMAEPEKRYPLAARDAYRQAVIRMHTGKPERAVPYIDEEVRLAPKDLTYRTIAALLYHRNGNIHEAERQARMAVSLYRRAMPFLRNNSVRHRLNNIS
jgi:tetratricopeptide (TPR) repeat protein